MKIHGVQVDAGDLEALATLAGHPGMEVLARLLRAERDRYFANFAAGLATSRRPVDQREVDEKRGFWDGVLYVAERYPALAEKKWERFVEAAIKESESPERDR